MKRSIAIALALCLLMVFSLLAGCTTPTTTKNPAPGEPAVGGNATSSTVSVNGKGLKIALSQQHLTNDFNRGVLAGSTAMAKQIGAELITANAKGDSNQQVADIENFLTLGVDAVIIGGGEGPAFAPVMKTMADKGIPCITVDIASQYSTSNVTSDNFNGGEQLGHYVVNRLRGKGNILILDTPGWQSLIIRIRMLKAVTMDYPNMKVAQTISIGTQDAVNNYYKEVKAYLLGNSNTQVVYCSWGLAAVGASQAIRELGMQDKVFVVCTDADQVVLEEMRKPDSPLAAVVGQYPDKLGASAVELAAKAAADTQVPVEVYAPIILIEKKDSKAWFSAPAIMSVDEAWKTLYPAAK